MISNKTQNERQTETNHFMTCVHRKCFAYFDTTMVPYFEVYPEVLARSLETLCILFLN